MGWIILIVVIIIIAIIITVNANKKSDRLGEKVSGTQISGRLRVLSKNNQTFQDDKEAFIFIYDRGVQIMQSTTVTEVPWGAIYEFNSGNYSQIVNKNKSVIGRAAVGGLLFGDIGAMIGGMSGLQQSQVDVGGDLFVMSFNYDNRKTIIGLKATYGFNKFISKLNRLKQLYDNSEKVILNAPVEIYSIGKYNAIQIIQEEHIDLCNSISYNKTEELLIIDIDGRGANFNILLNNAQKTDFTNLLLKVLEWQEKAIAAALVAKKEVGEFQAKIQLTYANSEKFAEGGITMTFDCWFDAFNPDIDDVDNCYNIMLYTPEINIVDEDVAIPAAIIFLKISSVKSILSLISDENIESAILKKQEEDKKIDSILS